MSKEKPAIERIHPSVWQALIHHPDYITGWESWRAAREADEPTRVFWLASTTDSREFWENNPENLYRTVTSYAVQAKPTNPNMGLAPVPTPLMDSDHNGTGTGARQGVGAGPLELDADEIRYYHTVDRRIPIYRADRVPRNSVYDVVIGFDSEWQSDVIGDRLTEVIGRDWVHEHVAKVATEANALRRQVLCYQLSVTLIGPEWGVGGKNIGVMLVFPPAGRRLRLAAVLSCLLHSLRGRVAFRMHRRSKRAPWIPMTLVSHFGCVDVTALDDGVRYLATTANLRKCPVTLDGPVEVQAYRLTREGGSYQKDYVALDITMS